MKKFLIAACCLALAAPAAAQLGERPSGVRDTTAGPKDLTGLSIKSPRVRIVHTTDPSLMGGSMHLQQFDPFLAFKMGKDLTQREFRPRDGVFEAGDLGSGRFRGVLTDGFTPAIVGNDQLSCGGCHALPYRDAGAGTNFAKKSGRGRNATHFYGSGIQEMIAWQVRQKMMQQIDTNRDNWVSKSEMNASPVLVAPKPGATPIDYGKTADMDGDGWPDLNNIFRVWFVNANGQVVAASSINDPGVAGFNFVMEVFGWGEKRFNLNTTNRIFAWDPLVAHGGLDAHDPTTAFDPDNDGFSQVSNAGFQQSWIGHIPPDAGNTLNANGLSLDDPDGDGVINEISEGDLDMFEWYMLNSPRPAMGRQTAQTERGDFLFKQWGCDSCHVDEWYIEPADPNNPDIHKRYLGDLRFFDIDVRWSEQNERLEGSLNRLYTIANDGSYVRNKDGFMVQGIGGDFKHHPMGPRLADMQYDGVVVTDFRTGLLWGNGASGFPWGHDGLSMTLADIIVRHGGASRMSRNKFVNASQEDQSAVIAYLNSHTLFSTDQTPIDINGDGRISENFLVAGQNTGVERFNPEWLFATAGEIEGYVINPEGAVVRSDALMNREEAYALDLPYLADTDLDGFADIQDDCPSQTGYFDGCN